MKKTTILSKRLAQYASMAGAVLAVSSAQAQIVYTDLSPDVVIGPDSDYHLDLNNDGLADFKLEIVTFVNGNNEPDFSMYIVNEFNYMHSQVLVYSFNQGHGGTVKHLDYGYSINEDLGKWDAFGVLGSKSNAAWDDEEKYAGLHLGFPGVSGQHYGWVRIVVQSDDLNNLSITVKDYAYNSEKNEPIFAGEGTPAACTDSYEPNNNFSKAASISLNAPVLSLINPAGDKDFYQVNVTPDQPNLQIVLSDLPKNYDVALYNASKQKIAVSKNKKKANDTIVYNNATAGTYYIKVYQKEGTFDASNCYSLNVQASLSPFKFIAGEEDADILDVKLFPNPANQFLTLQLDNEVTAEIPVSIFDLEGREMMSVILPAGAASTELNISSLTTGMYLMKAVIGSDVVMKKFSVVK